MTLEQEAENYLDGTYSLSYERTTWQKLHIKSFIAGANSKFVQIEKIKTQIEILEEINNKCFGGSNTCKAKIKELQSQLKELEK